VQTLTNGGAGSKSNPTRNRGILGIGDSCRCRLEYRGCRKQPLNKKPNCGQGHFRDEGGLGV